MVNYRLFEPPRPMNCIVFKSTRKRDTYLFVSREDDLARLPEPLSRLLGKLEEVMSIELHEGRRLAHARAAEVMRRIEVDGFYLQLPPASTHPLDEAGSAQ
jgi:uncharacterized protein YcgL (UPF0745 family)